MLGSSVSNPRATKTGRDAGEHTFVERRDGCAEERRVAILTTRLNH